MPKYINADQFLADESEAFIKAQIQLARSSKDITYKINEVVHKKIQMLISDAPAEDVQPVIRGKWIDKDGFPNWAICSECGYTEEWANENNFCPNCGSYNGGDTE